MMRRRLGDEIGRRSGLKIRGREACGFESRPGHQPGILLAEMKRLSPPFRRLARNGRRHHRRSAPTEHGPVNANEIAIYAVETRAIIHILWGLLLIAAISLIGVSIT